MHDGWKKRLFCLRSKAVDRNDKNEKVEKGEKDVWPEQQAFLKIILLLH
jgi:hypothetical protein